MAAKRSIALGSPAGVVTAGGGQMGGTMGPLAKLRGLVAELGAVDGTLYALDRLWRAITGRGLVYRYELVAQPVAERPRLAGGRGSAIAVRALEPGDPALAELPLSEAVIAARFAQGATCLAAFRDGRVIGCLWYVLGAYEEDEVRACFVPEGMAAWDFDLYLAPAARGGLGFARLWDAADERYRAAGVAWSMSRISRFNAPSLAAHRRAGARSLGRATFVVLGPVQLTLASRPPRLHCGVRRRPVFRLAPPP